MIEEDIAPIYDAPPMWAKVAAALLLGVGGLVLVPIAAVGRAWWLLLFAVPLLLAGLLLLQIRLRIAVERRTSTLRIANSLFGVKLRRRQYRVSDVLGLDLHRVAGNERERDSDTWYLRLQLPGRQHIVGRYDSRFGALEARQNLSEILHSRPRSEMTAVAIRAARQTARAQTGTAEEYFKAGLLLMRSGDRPGARQALEKALAASREPLLRRMIEQRLGELDRR